MFGVSLAGALVEATVKSFFVEFGLYAFALALVVLAVLAFLYMPRWPLVSRLRAPAIGGLLIAAAVCVAWDSGFRSARSLDQSVQLRLQLEQAKLVIDQKNVQAQAAAQEYIAHAERVAQLETENGDMQSAIDDFTREEADHDAKTPAPRACFDFDAFSRSLRRIDAGSGRKR